MRLRLRLVTPFVILSATIAGLPGMRAEETSAATVPVELRWLDGAAPAVAEGVSWGVPWAKGALQKNDSLVLHDAHGATVPMQTWPLAYWPDGSIKWSGHGIVATPQVSGPLALAIGAAEAAPVSITVRETETEVAVDTGAMVARLPKRGSALVESLHVGGRAVASNGHLTLLREDRSEADAGVLRYEEFSSRVERVTVEQAGPVRAVVKIEGRHASVTGERQWLPFTVRLYFFAGSGEMRIVHSFVFDGDQDKDFIKGLGMAFDVPFVEELHNRHMRFAGDGGGAWVQPVRLMPGYRPSAGPQVTDNYADHLAGKRMPKLADLEERAQRAVESVAVYNDARLTQLGPDGYSIDKRTTAASSWLHVMHGRRAPGLAVLGDVSGGIAVGLKDFWQKAPSSLEIRDAASDVGRLFVWFWSPDAAAMDLRHYDTVPHGLPINYEDWKPGWATPEGIANTSELTLRAFAEIPSDAELAGIARTTAEPPMLVCTPEYYHAQQAFGFWSLPDRSTPTACWVEDQVGGLVDFYRTQVEERGWYGFWDFGDIMHNYDFGRHEWRYDVGGWAWANTELMPDMLLWYSFLRTGRADLFRMASAMTRHTSEVDVHHSGPFAPLGSRHNVSHWGDGAKQPRISHAGLKRFSYYLTTDERVGDLLREQLDADKTYAYLQRFNGAHYLPTPDGGYRLERPGLPEAPRPEDFAPPAFEREVARFLALDWMCYAMNWTTEWERTGDTRWRDLVWNDMQSMTASVENGRFRGRYFDMIFGGPENMAQMEPMYDLPEFWTAWANTCEAVGREVTGNHMTGPRMLAYAARARNDAELGRMAWEKLIGNALDEGVPEAVPVSRRVESPGLAKPVHDPVFLGSSVGWQLHGVASVQWALNAIETLELARPWLADWEREHTGRQ